MDVEENVNSQPAKVSKAGIIGFVIGFASIACLLLGLGGIVSLGLTAIPGFFFSIIGLYRKGHRVFASFGLAISLMWLCLLSQIFISFSPPGLVPQPLQKLIYSPGGFWQDYDSSGLVDSNFHGGSIFGGSGWLYFKSDSPGTYTIEDAISFAEKNGWIYAGKTTLQTQIFSDNFKDGRIDWENDFVWSQWDFFMYIIYFHQIPFKIQRDCTIAAFEASKPHYVMVSSDGKEMEVRVITARAPDPPIAIPDEFKK